MGDRPGGGRRLGHGRGVAVVVRNVVPAALLRPEEVIKSMYALSDQGLRLTRRLALTVVGSIRSLTA